MVAALQTVVLLDRQAVQRKDAEALPKMLALRTEVNLRSGSIFVSLCKLYTGGQGETKREPDTNL